MSQTALHPWLSSAALVGGYIGVETSLSFGDPAVELAALRSGCSVFSLNWRAKINVTGKDRVRWLHNMVTNNVRDLPPYRGTYAFVLNAQGRILGDIYIYNRGESFVLDTDARQVEPLLTAMKRFIIMDKVEMLPAGEAVTAFGICGPKAQQVLASAGLDLSGMQPLELRDTNLNGSVVTVAAGPGQKPGWFEIWLDPTVSPGLWATLIGAGAQPIGAEALEIWRVLHGIPNYGQDIRDRDLPQETGQMQALSFTKGCYIGQEIVERIRSRGQVHRKFVGFVFPDQVAAIGKYESEGRAVAEITSLARVPDSAAAKNLGTKNIGLGYVRHEALVNGAGIDLNGIQATVVDLPFEIGS